MTTSHRNKLEGMREKEVCLRWVLSKVIWDSISFEIQYLCKIQKQSISDDLNG